MSANTDEKGPPQKVGAPKTYWEHRCLAMEGCVERLMAVVAMHLPASENEIAPMYAEWSRIREEIHKEFEEEAQTPPTDPLQEKGAP